MKLVRLCKAWEKLYQACEKFEKIVICEEKNTNSCIIFFYEKIKQRLRFLKGIRFFTKHTLLKFFASLTKLFQSLAKTEASA